jgi:magnesium chelatase subunit D
LELARHTIERALLANQSLSPMIVLISDGKANVGLHGRGPWPSTLAQAKQIRERAWRCVVVDLDTRGVRTGLARALAAELNGRLISLGGQGRPAE